VCDLAFKGEDILTLIPDRNAKIAQAIVDKMIVAILSGEIINDYDVLKVYVINELKNQDIAFEDSKVAYDYHPPVEEGAESINPSYKKETATLDDQFHFDQLEHATSEEELSTTLEKQKQIIKDYTEHRLDMLERRLNEQDRLLKEKDLKMAKLEKESRERRVQEDIEKLVNKNMELLKDSNYLNNPQKDKTELSRKLQQAYLDYIQDFDDRYAKHED
jgi:uncharacterized coiled-coil protein SlyX